MFGFSLLVQQEKDRQLSLPLSGHVPWDTLIGNAKNDNVTPRFEALSLAPVEPKALPHAVLGQLARKYAPLIERVLSRLSEAERTEANLHLKADYRQSWICLSLANKGLAEPFVQSSYQIYGLHPSKVWEAIVADRKARLGAEYYDWYTSDDMPRPDVPKIPPTRDVEYNEHLEALMNFAATANGETGAASLPTPPTAPALQIPEKERLV